MKRRRFILAATGGTAALAGCFDSDADDVDTPEDVDDDGPPDDITPDEDDVDTPDDVDDDGPPDDTTPDEDDEDPEGTEPADTESTLTDVFAQVVTQLNDGDTDAANTHIHPDSSRSFSRDSLPEVAYTLEETELLGSENGDADLHVVLSDGDESATFEYTFREHEAEQWRVLDWVVHRDWGEQERDPQATPEDVLTQFLSYLNEGNTGDATTLMHPKSPRSLSQGSLPQEAYVLEETDSTGSEDNQTVLHVILRDGEEFATFEYTLQRSGDGPWDIFDWEQRSDWGDERDEDDHHVPDAEPDDVLRAVISSLNDGNTGGANDRLHSESSRSYAQDSLPQETYVLEETEQLGATEDRTVLRAVISDGGESATFEYVFRMTADGQWVIFDWEQRSDWGDEPSDEDDRDPDATPEEVLTKIIGYLNDGNTGGANDRLQSESSRSYAQDSLPQEAYVLEDTEQVASGDDETVLRAVISDGGDPATFEYIFRRNNDGGWDVFDWEQRSDWGGEPSDEDDRDPDGSPEEVLTEIIGYLNDGNTGGANDWVHPDSPRSYSQASLPLEEYVLEETEQLDASDDETVLRAVISDGDESATFEYTFYWRSDGWEAFDWEIVEPWG